MSDTEYWEKVEAVVDELRRTLPPAPFDPHEPSACPSGLCDHQLGVHEANTDDDPILECAIEECSCGAAPRGWHRVINQGVWWPGETVPAGVTVMDCLGERFPADNTTSQWTNTTFGPLVEISPVSGPPQPSPVRGCQRL